MALRVPSAAPDVFSTSETNTGKTWVDGKPIYRKVIAFGNLPNANSKTIPHNIAGMGSIILVRAFAGGAPIPGVGGSVADYMTVWADAANIGIWCGGNKSASAANVIIEYTKI